MSACTLSSSLLITAVLLESLISHRFSDSPVVVVRTFQHPNLSADLFMYFFSYCLVQGLTVRPTNPVRQAAVARQHSTGWGLPSLGGQKLSKKMRWFLPTVESNP